MRRSQKSNLRISLDKRSRLPLPEQIYEAIERLIAEQQLSPGRELPSSRALADQLAVARATVVSAYKLLQRDGYIETNIGGKTSVSRLLPAREIKASQRKAREVRGALSRYCQQILAADSPYPELPDKLDCSFNYWEPAVDQRPLRTLSSYFTRVLNRTEASLLTYAGDAMGYEPLRKAIAESLKRSHRINCHSDNIVIVAGLPQVLQLIARIHIERGDFIAMENPGYPPTKMTFEMEGAVVVPISVDGRGLSSDELLSHTDKLIRVAYLTPSHQFPTGTLLDLSRRLELLTWARNTGAVIVEDEHDSAFNYNTQVLPSLKALDLNDDVVFVGTFAKLLFPSMAIAYMVVPERLREAYRAVKHYSSDQVPTVFQAALAEFISDGGLQRHTRRMKQIYRERRDALLDALRHHFADRAEIFGEQAGLHVLVRFKTEKSDEEILLGAAEAGIGLFSTREFYFNDPHPHEFIFGYANLEPHKIKDAIARLSALIT